MRADRTWSLNYRKVHPLPPHKQMPSSTALLWNQAGQDKVVLGCNQTFWILICILLPAGRPLEFIQEPDNPYDSNAVKVLTLDGLDLGYVPRTETAKFQFRSTFGHVISVGPAADSGLSGVLVYLSMLPWSLALVWPAGFDSPLKSPRGLSPCQSKNGHLHP